MAEDDNNINDDGKKTDDKKTDDKVQKIELTQDKLDKLIDAAYARGAKNSAEAKEVEKMKTELEELRGIKEWLEAEAAKKIQ